MSTHAIDTTFQEHHAPPPAPLGVTPSLVEQAISSAIDFDRLKASLLDRKRHINNISGKDRVNAAGWQVIGAALGVRIEIISKNAQGTPGAFREVLEGDKGKKFVSYSITVRATAGNRVQERSGRCDSTEGKHNQYEHKMESVAFTRAFNRAVCAIVGGEPGDNAEDAEDDQENARAQSPRERQQYPSAILMKLHGEKGLPEGSLRAWSIKHVPGFAPEQRGFTQAQSVVAYKKLSTL